MNEPGVIPRSPGRPRSERAEKAILEATLELLAAEAGVAGVSIEAVAARAGVGKTTIYRRWPRKEALIVDALATIKRPMPALPPGGTLRDDLLAVARSLGAEQNSRNSRCFWNVLGSAEKHPELLAKYRQEVIEPRREFLRTLLRRGIDNGELLPGTDLEVAMSLLVGAMTLQSRALAPIEALPEDFAGQVVDAILLGLAPGRGRPAEPVP